MNNMDNVFSAEHKKMDRRVQRTRELLKNALMQLVDEKGYDAVTIQDITERANLGRTTFYLHYESKDDLLLDHHADFASHLSLRPLSYDELLSETTPLEFEQFLNALDEGKSIYLTVTRSKDAEILMRGVRQQMVQNLVTSLKTAFAGRASTLSLDLLAQYLVGAQLALIDWWLTTRTDYEAKDIAHMIHQLQRAALHDVYGAAP